MTKTKKIICILLNLIFFLYLVIVSLSLYPIMALPVNLHFFTQLILGNVLILQVLFWLSMVLGICSILLFLYIIIYPKSESQFTVSGSDGSLTIDKKAIEGLTKASLNEKNFVSSPKVKVRAIRKKLHIKVIGELKRTSNLIDQEVVWKNQLKHDIKQLVGSDKGITIDIDFRDLYKEKISDKKEPRVV